MKEIEIVQYGVGPIGAELVKYALRRGIKIAGAIEEDLQPETIRRSVNSGNDESS